MTITNEDNMELMSRYKDNHFDLAIVDPPYRDSNQPTKDMRASGSMKSLEGRPSEEYFNELCRVSKEQIIWGANNFQLPQFKGFFVWDKGMPFDFTMSMAEIASLSEGIGTISKIWKFRIARAEDRIHPTQKPVKLYEKLLMTYAKEEDKILDTHLGSGSIAIACHNLGYDLTACELDKDYYKAAIKRIDQHKSQTRLF
jgi:site-specific DNA-methyltransferase (adenine-specific)